MPKHYEVVESKVWKRDDGRTASIYGACPWYGAEEKKRWKIEVRGWTIRDNHANTIGLGRIPWKDEQACKDYCEKINREYEERVLANIGKGNRK